MKTLAASTCRLVLFFTGNTLTLSSMKKYTATLFYSLQKHGLKPILNNFVAIPILLLFLTTCNFNFPEENQDPIYDTELKFHFNSGTEGGVINLLLPDFEKVSYRIIVFPQWIDIKSYEGVVENGDCFILFEFGDVTSFMQEGRAEGYIFVKVGKEVLRLTVSYGMENEDEPPVEGQVPLYCSVAEINLETGSNVSFTIANQGQVDKSWYITNIPTWLELSQTSGYLLAGASLTISCTVNRQGIAPGTYSQIIHIESNNPQLSHGVLIQMTVSDTGNPVNSSKLKWFEGTVTDAFYSKATDNLYILTKSPNNLLVKASGSDSLMAYPLERIPNCIDVTADGKTLAIGYNQANVDLLDAGTLTRIREYETDCVPFDLVFGENGWCYLAPDKDQWVHLYSLNLTTGVTFRTRSASLYEKSVLRKMPGKPLLYYTRPQLSPSGIQIVNIEKGAANDTIPGWHEDNGGMIWLTKSGDKIIGGNRMLYRTPEYTTETFHLDLPKIGTVEIPRNYLKSLDYNEQLQCWFAVGSDYQWGTENSETIYQVNETSLSAEKSVRAGSYPGYLINQYNPAMDVHHVFSNTEGSELYAIKNVLRNLEVNIWALEIFELPLN
jgi:hypothetical protein